MSCTIKHTLPKYISESHVPESAGSCSKAQLLTWMERIKSNGEWMKNWMKNRKILACFWKVLVRIQNWRLKISSLTNGWTKYSRRSFLNQMDYITFEKYFSFHTSVFQNKDQQVEPKIQRKSWTLKDIFLNCREAVRSGIDGQREMPFETEMYCFSKHLHYEPLLVCSNLHYI